MQCNKDCAVLGVMPFGSTLTAVSHILKTLFRFQLETRLLSIAAWTIPSANTCAHLKNDTSPAIQLRFLLCSLRQSVKSGFLIRLQILLGHRLYPHAQATA